jgi:hypothetical protein
VKTLCKNYLPLLNEQGSDPLFILYFPMYIKFNRVEDLGKIFSDSSDYGFCLYSRKTIQRLALFNKEGHLEV